MTTQPHDTPRTTDDAVAVTVTAPRQAVRRPTETAGAWAKLQPTIYLPGRDTERRFAA